MHISIRLWLDQRIMLYGIKHAYEWLTANMEYGDTTWGDLLDIVFISKWSPRSYNISGVQNKEGFRFWPDLEPDLFSKNVSRNHVGAQPCRRG